MGLGLSGFFAHMGLAKFTHMCKDVLFVELQYAVCIEVTHLIEVIKGSTLDGMELNRYFKLS